jgi:hypothetical protein
VAPATSPSPPEFRLAWAGRDVHAVTIVLEQACGLLRQLVCVADWLVLLTATARLLIHPGLAPGHLVAPGAGAVAGARRPHHYLGSPSASARYPGRRAMTRSRLQASPPQIHSQGPRQVHGRYICPGPGRPMDSGHRWSHSALRLVAGRAGITVRYHRFSVIGLDLLARLLAPCLLGCDGTGRHDPASPVTLPRGVAVQLRTS